MLDEGDVVVQQTTLVHTLQVVAVNLQDLVQVTGSIHCLLELQARTVQDLIRKTLKRKRQKLSGLKV